MMERFIAHNCSLIFRILFFTAFYLFIFNFKTEYALTIDDAGERDVAGGGLTAGEADVQAGGCVCAGGGHSRTY